MCRAGIVVSGTEHVPPCLTVGAMWFVPDSYCVYAYAATACEGYLGGSPVSGVLRTYACCSFPTHPRR